jgi:acyl-CoA reductase-like NAD-dependent aldehyde dehydrogenase
MQEVLMAVSWKANQLPLFARAQCNPHWTNLSSDVQAKIVRLLAQLLRQHRETLAKTGAAEEACGE